MQIRPTQTRWLRAAALAACLAFCAPQALLAQDSGKDEKAAKGGSGLVETPKRTERAKEIVRQLEATKKRLKAAGALDEETRKALDRAIAHARALARPAKAADLTDDERKGLVDELAADIKGSTKSASSDDETAGGKLAGWQERAMRRAFEGIELGAEDRKAAEKIIGEWFSAATEARGKRDSKGQADAKRDRNRELRSLLGKKVAKQVIKNLDMMSGGFRGGRF